MSTRNQRNVGLSTKSPAFIMIVGCGYWGAKLAQRFSAIVGTSNTVLCDVDKHKALVLSKLVGCGVADYRYMLARESLDAVIIATPISTHFEIARESLEAGKHVFVEKPMATSAEEASLLKALATSKSLVLSSDLTFLHNPILVASDQVARLDWKGPASGRSDEGILWTWGPHPVSLMVRSRGRRPDRVDGFLEEDRACLTYFFADALQVHIDMQWGPDLPRQRLVTVGRDVEVNLSHPIDGPDPLARVCAAFVQEVRAGGPAIDQLGIQTVEVLEWTQKTLG